MLILGAIVAIVAVVYFFQVNAGYFSPAAVQARSRQARRDALQGRVLQVGDVVGVTFWGSPAVVIFAAKGSGATIESHIPDPQYASLVEFCDLPTVDLARTSGNNQPPTTWITDAGVNWSNNRNVCLSITTGLDGKIQSCTTDDDCRWPLPCDPTNVSTTSAWCPIDGGSGSQSEFTYYDCPPCVPCMQNSSNGNYYCSLSVQASFTCDTTFGPENGVGVCRMYWDSASGEFSCPPPAQCRLDGFPLPGATGGQTTCGAAGQTQDPSNPCTGCQPGQRCVLTGVDNVTGTCQGIAEKFFVLRAQFRAEGVVAGIDSQDGAVVDWQRLQMAYPYYYSSGSGQSEGEILFMPWLNDGQGYPVGSAYHLGCRLLAEQCDWSMRLALFGSIDPGNFDSVLNPTGWNLVEKYYAIASCPGGSQSSGGAPCFQPGVYDQARTSWPLMCQIDRVNYAFPSPNDTSMGYKPGQQGFQSQPAYFGEVLGTAQDAAAALQASQTAAGISPYDIPTANSYDGIAAEVGIASSEEYMNGLVGNWTSAAVSQVDSNGPWQFNPASFGAFFGGL
jgi:hypothetical protein